MSTPDPAVSVGRHNPEARIAGGETLEALTDPGRLDINFPGVAGEANQDAREDLATSEFASRTFGQPIWITQVKRIGGAS